MKDPDISISDKDNVSQAAGTVGFFTFLSRILGLIRDMVLARYFGSGMAADAFFVAFRIPNLLRRLFAEGSLTIACSCVSLRSGLALYPAVRTDAAGDTGISHGDGEK